MGKREERPRGGEIETKSRAGGGHVLLCYVSTDEDYPQFVGNKKMERTKPPCSIQQHQAYTIQTQHHLKSINLAS